MGRLPSVWRRRGPKYTVTFWLASNLAPLWNFVNRDGLLHSLVNENIINQFVSTMEPRPDRLSTKADYTSWDLLTDRTYSNRHLPPTPSVRTTPPPNEVAELFRRSPSSARDAKKSTLLFPFFAQWFVDGFLRTDPTDVLRNTSTHDIDLSQLYGPHPGHTASLRAPSGGKLRSERGVDGELPPRYFDDDGNVRPEFADVQMIYPGGGPKSPDPGIDSDHPVYLSKQRLRGLFALGLPRGNIHYGTALMSTIFLREHNRLADLIAKANNWDPVDDDDRIFETARNVLIVMLLKVVIEDYMNHITPFHFKFVCEPGTGAERKWFRPNWMSIEFDLLYRWHALVPDVITVGRSRRAVSDLLWDMDVLRTHGVATLVDEASKQPCMEVGLLNTPPFLLEVEERSIEMGRTARLASYNDYRQACGYPRLDSFADVSFRPDVQAALARCYSSVDDIELYVGLFAEDVVIGGVLGDLMGTMVGVDAFSQALTNPLLAPQIFSVDTFSEVGMAEIAKTNTLSNIVDRVVPIGRKPLTSFDRR